MVAADDPPGGLQAVQRRHAHVHQHHVRPQLSDSADRLEPVGRLAGDLDVGLGVQQHREGLLDHRLVVGDQHPHAHAPAPDGRGSTAATA
jgi:hypothetical protein